jgi:phosphonopyruvate decarboxylase
MKLDFLNQYEFFAGVPDSLLKPLSNYLMDKYGISKNHIIAANEGNAVALAMGYHLSTGKVPVVYLQNSGIGNIINPVVSLMNDKIYGIPCVFIVGWRGEPGVHDEPQHVFQGEITVELLEDIGIKTFIISKETTKEDIDFVMQSFSPLLDAGKQVAFIVKKEVLEFESNAGYQNQNVISREQTISKISDFADEDIIISTTGKASRELFEIREKNRQKHNRDFLTIGGMGHSSSIALSVALQHPGKKVWCIDGDGAALMHMGAMALIGSNKPDNLIHVVINNSAHESVGCMPTVASKIDFAAIAKGCGYTNVMSADNLEMLERYLLKIKAVNKLSFLEIKCSVSARSNLGRPTVAPKENKEELMKTLIRNK